MLSYREDRIIISLKPIWMRLFTGNDRTECIPGLRCCYEFLLILAVFIQVVKTPKLT